MILNFLPNSWLKRAKRMWKSFPSIFATQQYMDLAATEDHDPKHTTTRSLEFLMRIQSIYPVLTAVLLTSLVCLFLANYYHLFTHGFLATNNSHAQLPSSEKPIIYTNCGDSPSVARGRGCSFDLLSFSWQTPECYDEPLLSSFLAYPPEPWRYYTNSSATEEIPQSVAVLGEMDLYVTWEYHVVHCTFMWMQMHRAFTERKYIDSHLDNWDHTKHCQIVALERTYGPDVVNVKGKLQYPDCRPVTSGLFPMEADKAKNPAYDPHHIHH